MDLTCVPNVGRYVPTIVCMTPEDPHPEDLYCAVPNKGFIGHEHIRERNRCLCCTPRDP